MVAFRAFFVLYWLALVAYTVVVIGGYGMNLFAVFFSDMAAMNWAGQFNFDFMGFLCLSATWVAWRHHFRAAGFGLAVLAFFGGIGFLVPYLLYAIATTQADPVAVLVGPERTGR